MSGIPLWISITQLILTFLLGLGAAAIAFMQWRTAHQKVVLDLFDRRQKVIGDLFDAVTDYFDGNHLDPAKKFRFSHDAEMLFGSDIANQLERITRQIQTKADPVTTDKGVSLLNELDDLYEACHPFLRMDQKQVRSPAQWFHDQNRKRNSFGDQPAP